MSESNNTNKRIGIDCRLAGLKHAGIGRYVQHMVRELLTNDSLKEIDWFLFFYDQDQAEEVLGQLANAQNCHVIFASIRHYSLKEQFLMPLIFAKYKLDLLHVPHFNAPLLYRGKLVLTIHDLLWHEHQGSNVTTLPAWQYAIKYKAYRAITDFVIDHAVKIFVPAKTVAKTIQKYYPNISNKIIVTLEGIGDEFLRFGSEKNNKSSQSKQLIYTGSLYPHKNVEVILQALTKLPDFSLKIVGSRSVFANQVKKRVAELGIDKQVEFLDYLTDEELIKQYQQSLALIQPSFSEGFGLTGVEALAVGLPIITSDIPIFHEVYQDFAIFFNPNNANELIAAIKKLANNSEIAKQPDSKFFSNYQWSKMANIIGQEYLKLL